MKAFLAVALVFATSAANAITVGFGEGTNVPVVTQTVPSTYVDDIEFTATGYEDFSTLTTDRIYRTAAGWGVVSDPGSNRLAGAEALSIDFGTETYILNTVSLFETGTSAEQVELYVDGVFVTTLDLAASSAANDTVEIDLSALGIRGSVFDFLGTNVGDGIRVSEMTIAVPLPAAGLLLLTAVGGLALRRRRKA